MDFNTLQKIYNENFSLGYLASDINTKFALISLICYIVTNMQKKKPDVTYYQVVHKLCETSGWPDNEVKGLAIMCEAFGYGCTEFPTFNVAPKEIPKTIRQILNKKLPF